MEITYEIWMRRGKDWFQFTGKEDGSPLIPTRAKAEAIAKGFLPKVDKVVVIERRPVLELNGYASKVPLPPGSKDDGQT